MAYNHNPLKVLLTLEKANKIVSEGFKIARKHNISPLAIVVLDSGAVSYTHLTLPTKA